MKSLQPELMAIGTLGRPHAIHGELNALLTMDYESLAEHVEGDDSPIFLFIEIEGLPVPYRLEAVRPKGEGRVLLSLAGIDSKEAALALSGQKVLIESALVGESDQFLPTHLVGFVLYDEKERVVGTITRVDDSTLNILLEVTKEDGDTLLVPLADELIRYLELEKRIIGMQLPEGLSNI